MEDGELNELYASLAEIATQIGLDWIVEELDEAIALGATEVKSFRQSSYRGETTYHEVTARDRTSPGRSRAEEFLSRRPLSSHEQVEALVSGMRRALVDIHEIARASVGQLGGLPASVAPTNEDKPFAAPSQDFINESLRTSGVDQILFVPDQGANDSEISTLFYTERGTTRDELAQLFNELLEVIRRD